GLGLISEKIVVFEELEPLIENALKKSLHDAGVIRKVYGKDLLPATGEYDVDIVKTALNKVLMETAGGDRGVGGADRNPNEEKMENMSKAFKEMLDAMGIKNRIPALCAGCPHRSSYLALLETIKGFPEGATVFGDRGCYNQGAQPPLEAIDTCICMGASIAMASGFYHSKQKEKAVAVIGDGTFYHAGVPGLINAVHNWSDITVMILDNSITSMTGRQPNAGTGFNAKGDESLPLDLVSLVKACGVEFVMVADAFNQPELKAAIKAAMEYKGPAVVISRGPCALFLKDLAKKERTRSGEKEKEKEKTLQKPNLSKVYSRNQTYQKRVVVKENCTGCRVCMKKTGCPAMSYDKEKKKIVLLDTCNGCGLCSYFCRLGAIGIEELNKNGPDKDSAIPIPGRTTIAAEKKEEGR
ncbi:MAG: thiamine pyrophosphate-dependent enzyme, partial [Thermoplasmata archaeon]